MFSSAPDKAKLCAEKFSKNSNHNYSGISLRVLPSRTNLKLYRYFFNSQEGKKFITNFDLSKASGSDWRPVVVLKNCESDPSFTRADRFNNCLKESCFPDC